MPPPPSLYTRLWYLYHKIHYAAATTNTMLLKEMDGKNIGMTEMNALMYGCVKYVKRGRMTYFLRNEGETLLVRRLAPLSWENYVGDLVVLKNPEAAHNYLVRRLIAREGDEMVSTDDKEEHFVLGEEQVWVVAENENLKPKEVKDSRSFGPLNLSSIVGRVIYRMRKAGDHAMVQNSASSMRKDWPMLVMELDVQGMSNYHKD